MPTDYTDLELLTASLRADAHDLAVFVEALARKLEDVLPQRTKVTRRSRRLFSRLEPIKQITIDLGDERYLLAYDGRDVETMRARAVSGITLKHEPLALEQWIESLARAVAAEARASEHGRQALEKLLLGGGNS